MMQLLYNHPLIISVILGVIIGGFYYKYTEMDESKKETNSNNSVYVALGVAFVMYGVIMMTSPSTSDPLDSIDLGEPDF